MKTCRVCYENDEKVSKLISPCNCKGTGKYIHDHCLRNWQAVAKSKPSLLQHAFVCQICKSYYRHSSLFSVHFVMGFIHKYQHQLNAILNAFLDVLRALGQWISSIAIIYACLPIKFVLYNLLRWLCVVFGEDNRLALNNFVLHTDEGKNLYFKSYQHPYYPRRANVGDLLVASRMTPASSMFHRKVILLVQHDPYKSVGVILNDTHPSSRSGHSNSNSISNSAFHQVRSEDNVLHMRHPVTGTSPTTVESSYPSPPREIGGQFNQDMCVLVHTQQPPRHILTKKISMMGESCPIFVTQCLISELEETVAAIESNKECCYCKQHGHQQNNEFAVVAGEQVHEKQQQLQQQRDSPLQYLLSYTDDGNFVDMATLVANSSSSSSSSSASSTSSSSSHSHSLSLYSSRPSSTSSSHHHHHHHHSHRCSRHHKHHMRVIRGVSMWVAGQLEGELRDGDWVSMPGSVSSLFTHSRASLWSALRNYYEVNHANIF